MLAGGSSVITGLPESLRSGPSSDLGHFAVKGMELASNLRERQLRLDAPALLDALRLAMRGSTMSIRVNLLPHREARRKLQKNAFFRAHGVSVWSARPWCCSFVVLESYMDSQRIATR